jgi:RNA polymerase sigma-70 factor, ECF subfamily
MKRVDAESTAIEQYIPNLRRYARALVRNPESADDLVQDTLERAMRKFHLWRPGNLRAWLFSIMHNVFVNQVRSQRSQYHDELDENLAAYSPSATRLDIRDLQEALEGITPDQREVLLLVALEDMSYTEVGKALDIPVGTVMSRLSRARTRLRSLMDLEAPRPESRKVA